MSKFFVRMPSRPAALSVVAEMASDPMVPTPQLSLSDESVVIADLEEDQADRMRAEGATLYADVQFGHFAGAAVPSAGRYWIQPKAATPMAPSASLRDVLTHIRAPQAWATGAKGDGVTIAVVDTGICGVLSEFPAAKRSPLDTPSKYQGQHWQDVRGHGSMCATIAGASANAGGKFDGVAPSATVLAARTDLTASDIYLIYQQLILWKRAGAISGPLVVSNSYGLYTCAPPNVLPADHPYMDLVVQAIDEGIVVVFAAGNNHYDVLCNHDPAQCSPTTIWGPNSHDKVLSVGTVNQQNSNRDPSTPHANSSRGPGQWASAYPKPDCVAPTYGEVVWGCAYQVMDWWGTSGACPQVAGLAALMLSKNPSLSPQQVGDAIRSTCDNIGAAHNCVGHGLINCENAVKAV